KVVPSKVVVDKDDETLVLVFDEALGVRDGVLEIKTYVDGGVRKNMAVTQFEPADARSCFNKWKDGLLSLATTIVCEEFSGVSDQSPESFVTTLIMKTSPEAFTQFPRMGAREQDNEMFWKSEGLCDGVYEIKQRPKSEWIPEKKKKSKNWSDWWMLLDEEKNVKEPKRRPAREWKLIDLVDNFIQYLDKEQALVCITVLPPLPVEYSPSPPSRFRSHRKARMLSQVQMWVCCKFGIVNAFSTDDLLPCNRNVNIPILLSLNVSSIGVWICCLVQLLLHSDMGCNIFGSDMGCNIFGSDMGCNIFGSKLLATDSFFPEWKIWTQFLEETAGGSECAKANK
ncbi:aminopeptidase M1-like protein isoform X1, partial [Tanacetum coccineum]